MKKIYSIAIILITFTIISCNNSSSKDLPDGYVNPGLTAKEISTDKGYNINIAGPPCSGNTCNAVLFHGTVNGNSQAGIVVDGGPGFNLKIYWDGAIDTSAVDTLDIPPTEYTIKVISGASTYISLKESPVAAGNLKIEITPNHPSDRIYTIQFQDSISISGTPIINNGNYIQAYKYP